jgi:radical SAM enzyme (TIGR01210 family)
MMQSEKSLYSQAKRSLLDALIRIRSVAPRHSLDHHKCGSIDIRSGTMNNEPHKRAVITLRTRGCDWGEIGGGCTMCGHYSGMIRDNSIVASEISEQFSNALASFPSFEDYPILCVYNGGSFLNPEEIPMEAQEAIFAGIGCIPAIRQVVIESRVDYCEEARILKLKRKLGDKELVIAVGLETVNDAIRDLSINKGLSLSRFQNKIQLIKRLGRFRVYLLLSCPFLTERESIEEAVASIKFVHELGAEAIHIEPLTIQKHTLAYYLWQKRRLKPPWLWSIIEVLRRCAPIPVYISPFAHYPKPLRIPENCPKCTDTVRSAILDHYNRHYDISIFDDLSCGCYSQYLRELEEVDTRPLEMRVIEDTQSISQLLTKSQSVMANLLSQHERILSRSDR